MTVKHIVLPLTGFRDESAVCRSAFGLSKALNAHVTAGFVEGDATIYRVDVGIAAPGYGALQQAMAELTAERRAKARLSFNRAVAAAKVPIVTKPLCRQSSTEWLDGWRTEDPIAACGGLADLAVVYAAGEGAHPEDSQIVEDMLFRARRPVLLVPSEQGNVSFSRPIIAWNGSAEAANAVRCAVDLFDERSQVTVVQVGDIHHGLMPAERVIDSLGWRCFAADLKCVNDAPHKTAQIILEQAKVLGATVLVMGAYTHSRTRELILGGVTNYMLQHADIPVLLAH